jgi:5'-AMP-activated protein kinase, regulatory gamma subunit
VRNFTSSFFFSQFPCQALGFVDGRDIVVGLVKTLLAHGKLNADGTNWEASFRSEEVMTAGGKYLESPVRGVVNKSGDDVLKIFAPSTALKDVVAEMAGLRLHRVVLMDGPDFHSVYSVSDLINFLAQKQGVWGRTDIGKLRVGELINDQKEGVFSLKESQPAIEGVALMEKNHVSGLAVVDEDGCIIANFSTHDFSKMMASSGAIAPPELFLPMHVFLLQQAQLVPSRAPVTCRKTDSLVSVVTKLALYRVHRVWVVDEENKPIGVITPFEVLRQFNK